MSKLLDSNLTLAMNVHAQPGVYALLLGSGLSSAAGIPTGWQVVQQLVAKASAALTPGDDAAVANARSDPEAWWNENGDGEPLGYSNLLSSMATTQAARQALLSSFFEATDADLAAGRKQPSGAHREIAALVKAGSVRVVLTTNFDRLLERALEGVGVAPVVLSNEAAIAAAPPLAHAKCVVVKLHGDWLDLEQRNTITELSTYPSGQNTMLQRVFRDYGLIVSGWSASWDLALCHALEASASRRYPMYWATFGPVAAEASKLISLHSATVIDNVTAGELFGGLRSRLASLDRLTEPPLSTALKVDRLKNHMLDPTKRIQVHDLFLDECDTIGQTIAAMDPSVRQTAAVLEGVMTGLEAVSYPLIDLLTTGVYYDRDRDYTDLWTDVVQRLMRARRVPSGGYGQYPDQLQHYPALLALRAAGLTAVLTGRDDVLLQLLARPTWRCRYQPADVQPAFIALSDWNVLDRDMLNAQPRWGGNARWHWPNSKLLREVLREALRYAEPDDEAYEQICDRYEYRTALTDLVLNPRGTGVTGGLFIGEQRWAFTDGRPLISIDFVDHADFNVWVPGLGLDSVGVLEERVHDLDEELKKVYATRPR
jgi:hypothetical protein